MSNISALYTAIAIFFIGYNNASAQYNLRYPLKPPADTVYTFKTDTNHLLVYDTCVKYIGAEVTEYDVYYYLVVNRGGKMQVLGKIEGDEVDKNSVIDFDSLTITTIAHDEFEEAARDMLDLLRDDLEIVEKYVTYDVQGDKLLLEDDWSGVPDTFELVKYIGEIEDRQLMDKARKKRNTVMEWTLYFKCQHDKTEERIVKEKYRLYWEDGYLLMDGLHWKPHFLSWENIPVEVEQTQVSNGIKLREADGSNDPFYCIIQDEGRVLSLENFFKIYGGKHAYDEVLTGKQYEPYAFISKTE